MAEIFDSSVKVTKAGTNTVTVKIDGNNGNITLGGGNADGDLALLDTSGNNRINFDAQNQRMIIRRGDGTIVVSLGDNGNLTLGGNGQDGDILMNKSNGSNTIRVDGHQANIWLGGNGSDGDIVLFPSSATNNQDTAQSTIHLDGNAGDIIFRNADCAEDFDVCDPEVLSPGVVMVIDENGKLNMGDKPYDSRVAGVVSGAGDYKAAMVLDRQENRKDRFPVALVGKVFCWVDADYSPVNVGDMLTTSSTPGHAMKAEDRIKSFGSVIGKALAPLKAGRNMIPILVALQ